MLETRQEMETQSLCQTIHFSSNNNRLKSLQSKETDIWGSSSYLQKMNVTSKKENHTSSPISLPWKKPDKEPMNPKLEINQISIDISTKTDINSFGNVSRTLEEKIKKPAEMKKNLYIPVKTNYLSPKNRNFADFGLSVDPLYSLQYKKVDKKEDPMAPYFTLYDEL